MPTTLHDAIYPGAVPDALDPQKKVTIRVKGLYGSPIVGVLQFVDSVGITHPIAKAPPDHEGGVRWVLNFEEGPELSIPPWQVPTRPPSRFQFLLEATAVNLMTEAEEPVLVFVCDDCGLFRANDLGTGGPVTDDAIEMAGTLNLFLEG
jgi:hypothetical protein